MADKLMYIPNDDTKNYLFCRLKLVVGYSTIKQPIAKVPKVVKSTNRKTLLYNFGYQCNKQPIVPFLSLTANTYLLILYTNLAQILYAINK